MFLVSCVSAKHAKALPARELYCSDWFLKARAYVEAQGEEWFILSAKYGLVTPDQVIEPYDEMLNSMSAANRRAWAERVAVKLRERCRPGMDVVILAGVAYREHLVPMLSAWGCRVSVPMEGLGIGQQKAWLKRAVKAP